KSARMYGFEHKRTAAQLTTTFNDLRTALPASGTGGLTLGVSNGKLLVGGSPIEMSAVEKGFAEMLVAGGVGSIFFSYHAEVEDVKNFARAFTASGTKNPQLGQQLKEVLALREHPAIKVNEIHYVASDGTGPAPTVGTGGTGGPGGPGGAGAASAAGIVVDSGMGGVDARTFVNPVVASVLATEGDAGSLLSGDLKSVMADPRRLLQMIAAAEGASQAGEEGGEAGMMGGFPSFAGGGGTAGPGTGGGGGSGDAASNFYSYSGGGGGGVGTGGGGGIAGGGGVAGGSGGDGSGAGGGTSASQSSGARVASTYAPTEDDVMSVIQILTRVGASAPKTGGGSAEQVRAVRDEIAKSPRNAKVTLQQALANLSAAGPAKNMDTPMMLQLAENMAIQFALDLYERGGTKVNTVKDMLAKLGKEIDSLRKILGGHEDKMKKAGMAVESYATVLDRQFWTSLPETGKRTMLLSDDAWAVPARNVRSFVEQSLDRGDGPLADNILRNYAVCLGSGDKDARARSAQGILELTDLYGRADSNILHDAITQAGKALQASLEEKALEIAREVGEAFTRLSRQAAEQKNFTALRDALELLNVVERTGGEQKAFAQTLRNRLGIEKQLSDFIDNALRSARVPEGLIEVTRRQPHLAADQLSQRMIRCGRKRERERLVEIAAGLGNEVVDFLGEKLRTGAPAEAVSVVGMLSRLYLPAVEELLPRRLKEWNRYYQDITVRQLACSGTPERSRLLLDLSEVLDPLVFTTALDEVGMCGDAGDAAFLLKLASGEIPRMNTPLLRLKAMESLGRLRAQTAGPLLRQVLEARQTFRWQYPREMRVAAAQALQKIDPGWLQPFMAGADISREDLQVAPIDPTPDSPGVRQRSYQRVKLVKPLEAKISTSQGEHKIDMREMSLGGGWGEGDKQLALPPGSEADVDLQSGWRGLKAHVLVRDTRATKFAYEIVEIDLEERGKLRKLLVDAMGRTA
ncbi:MAG TPA: hypothetical protein VKG84_15280, partial [Candidatus Acidoferrales bacterium]|nr:hypothetical protein [Candidatus Acidoferrales bacterium]